MGKKLADINEKIKAETKARHEAAVAQGRKYRTPKK